MLVEKITSRQNPLVKRFRRVRTGTDHHQALLEGIRLIEDAVSAGVHFETVAFTSALETSDRGLALLDSLLHVPCRGAHVSPQVMQAISDTETSQGVCALVSRPHFELNDAFASAPQLLVIADQLQDPGNLGSLIRSAAAAGATGVITTRQTVDPFNHKALRSSAGAALRLPLVAGAKGPEIAARCKSAAVKIIATQAAGPEPQETIKDASQLISSVKLYTEADYTGPVALVFGKEGSGLSSEATGMAEEFVHIPMAEGVESLNVAVAGAILLYEAARQRGFRVDGKPFL